MGSSHSGRRAFRKIMLTAPNITYQTNIYFGFGIAETVPALIKKHGIATPLVITDKALMQTGIINRIGLKAAAVFDDVETNPTEAMAVAALELYHQSGCDGIIAAGGGSPIDLAKIVGLLVHHPLPLEKYSIVSGGIEKITDRIPPLIAVPTTAGSGSEVGRAALITLSNGKKLGFLSEHLLPIAAVCDPELTITMSPLLTAATGMDAVSHCIETFCSSRYNPVADALALDGLERGYRNIITATRNGTDRHAREEMMMCSLQGGLSFQKGLGAVHSLSHPLGALTKKRLHHGTLNAIFLPVVLRFNFDYCKEKMQVIAKRLTISKASLLPEKFEQLIEELGLPARLRDLGVRKEDLDHLAVKAKEDHCTLTNPRPALVEDLQQLYLEAL